MKDRSLAAAALFFLTAPLPAEGFLPPKSFGDPAAHGGGIQRTMRLLASSTPEQRNPVRILFYGQSITEQDWWKETAAFLKQRYPNADLTIENRAIGGHSSPLLQRTAEADLYPFYPDLVIFHVYGSHTHYEDLIRRIRERTTAEILLMTDHMARKDSLDEPTDPASSHDQWNSFMNYNFLPSLAKKYRTGLLDQRNLWKKYLRDYQLEPAALLRDDVHLNENGCHLMAALVNAWLVPRLAEPHPDGEGMVRHFPPPTPQEETLTFKFEGNRLDALLTGKPQGTVLIDGKPVSAHPGAHCFTRSTGYPGTHWPCLLGADRGPTAPQEEEWTLTLTELNSDCTAFRFSLSGSKTGPDGSGTATERFTSPSGRIMINPADWNLAFCRKVFKKALPEPVNITWQSRLTGVDQLSGRPGPVILAQGLTNGPHTLTLTHFTGGDVRQFTVYRPPFPVRKP